MVFCGNKILQRSGFWDLPRTTFFFIGGFGATFEVEAE